MAKKNFLIGVAEIAAGALLISPADEFAVLLGSGGISIPTIPIQGKASALIGAALVYDGLKKI